MPAPLPPRHRGRVQGQHWTLDLSACTCPQHLLAQRAPLEELCRHACNEAGLTVVGSLFHQFFPTGVTGVVLLAESHLSVHTWPDERFVAVDVYVCNHLADNTAKGQALVERMQKAFCPSSLQMNEIPRRSVGER